MQCSTFPWTFSWFIFLLIAQSKYVLNKEQNVLKKFVLQSFRYIVDTNWTARKYFNLLNLNGLNSYYFKFRSMYGHSHERYGNKICVLEIPCFAIHAILPQVAGKFIINNFKDYFKMAVQRVSRIFSTFTTIH